MRFLFALFALILATLPAMAQPDAAVPRIAVISIHVAELPTIARAGAERVRGDVVIDFFGLGGGVVPGIDTADLAGYDLVLIDAAGPALMGYLDRIDAAKARTRVLIVGAGTPVTGNVDPAAHPDVARYWENATADNYAGLFAYLAGKVLGHRITVPPPVIYPPLALWHPDAARPFDTLAAYSRWAEARMPDAESRPRVGILFYRSLALAGNVAVIEALVREIERQGGMPIPIWRGGGADLASGLLGETRLDALILCGNRIDYADAARGVAEAQRLGVPPLSCGIDVSRTPAQWRESIGGFAPGQTGTLALGEMEGIVEPMIVGARMAGPSGEVSYAPIDEQVRWRVSRALSWAALKRMPNDRKRIVVTYHSEDGSEADVGSDPDSYLDAQASIVALLERLRAEGYDVGDGPIPDTGELARRLALEASNVPADDREMLDRRVAQGAVTVDANTYRGWYDALPQSVRKAVEARWGPPPGDRMISADGQIVIPALRFGKVVLAAHPVWGMEDARALSDSGALPPHHQYLAFYLWMQRQERAHAYLPLFTQLSLMPGKQQGPAADDAVGVLIGDLPHIAPLPLQANGGVGNKRRTHAVTIGFMPPFVRAGLPPELATIEALLAAPAPDHAAVRAAAAAGGLERVIDIAPADTEWSALEPALREYLAEVGGAPMPRGGHVLGQAPDAGTMTRIVQAMIAGNGDAPPPLGDIARALEGDDAALSSELVRQAREYARRLAQAPREMDAVVTALNGGYVPPGPMGDAIRNPDTLPAGRNPYTLDVRAMPTQAAWETGSALADDLIEGHRARTGAAPRKVAFILWSGEAAQNGGTSEAQILRLLGIRPVRNGRGQVIDVELEDRVALGRPRVDVLVTTSGTYRDQFGGQLALLAKAIGLAARADEADNPVREETRARTAALMRQGVTAELAQTRALRRIFSTAPGAYSPSTQFAVKEGWDASRMNRLYEDRLGFAYGGGESSDGDADSDAFAANLENVDAAVFARSSSAYGVLDTPLPAAYLGGLAAAVRERTGRAIETYVANGQQPGAARIETLARFYGRERDSRYLNPEWIRSMQASGYNGARYMADVGDSMLLWGVNTPELIADADWEAMRDVYVRDRHNLGMADFFARHNPAAREKMLRTMLDAVRRGVWNADAATTRELQAELMGDKATASRSEGMSGPPPALSEAGMSRAAPGGTSVAATAAMPSPPVAGQVSGFELISRQHVQDAQAADMRPRWNGIGLLLVLALLIGSGAALKPRW